ncbi:hypothetical protein SAMN05661096_01976 [Marivirga sericea]|uniref:Photosynthesis system II assembly factor Ycf48/Hcf136-like domain-containing protein n=1 Tax=Marivirga sericea TaxID=1028 RepID=A0A1X7JR75_9BACT|nr:hypothetical protein [Marivirga sericea]SMG30485.1 hypothetical protein SAMN05661096_01976 [Marivirga sericea]
MKKNILTGKKALNYSCIIFVLIFTVACGSKNVSPKITELKTNTDALIIGLQSFSDSVVWASGTYSTLMKSTNAGADWKVFTYPEVDSLQFRDVHPISEKEAIVLSAGEGKLSQLLYFHEEAGWKKVFQMNQEKGFIDAVQFWENGQGLVYGDAIDSLAYILKTTDFGRSWVRIPTAPEANEREGGFASSGSNILTGEEGEAWIATGANGSARVFYTSDYGRSWNVKNTPMMTGEFAGLTAIKKTNDKLWITGGDLAISDKQLQNVYYSDNNGDKWNALPDHQTAGSFYGVAVTEFLNNEFVLVCGPKGAEIWLGDQQKWQVLSEEDIWTATFIDSRTALIAGRNGKMWKVELE